MRLQYIPVNLLTKSALPFNLRDRPPTRRDALHDDSMQARALAPRRTPDRAAAGALFGVWRSLERGALGADLLAAKKRTSSFARRGS